ncbi:MAG: division/cell wall cluster transcriptional repressor MraZ [Spirochaetales bacterium]|nr:division/cell wall cluster transcriptional repressor MraZ [Spirochaetales bacterium]
MLTGEFKYSLDEKGRLNIPQRVRQSITGNIMIITRGIDKCIWLFPPGEWSSISKNLIDSSSMFLEKTRLIQRRILAPAQEIEMDKSGRISIPQTLREYAGLKKDCIILGMLKYVEIWDEEMYAGYWDENETKFQDAAEKLGDKITFKAE